MEQLFIDTLNTILFEFESSTTKLINKRTPKYKKIQQLSLVLAYMRSNLYKSLLKFIKTTTKNTQPVPNSINKQYIKLEQQMKISQTNLNKLNLHNILVRKLEKLQKQSMINSISMSVSYHQQNHTNQINYNNQSQGNNIHNNNNSNNNNQTFYENQQIRQLRQSLKLIESDLGIQSNQLERDNSIVNIVSNNLNKSNIADRLKNMNINFSKDGESNNQNKVHNQSMNQTEQLDRSVSYVVHRSMASIQGTPIRSNLRMMEQSILNQSVVSNNNSQTQQYMMKIKTIEKYSQKQVNITTMKMYSKNIQKIDQDSQSNKNNNNTDNTKNINSNNNGHQNTNINISSNNNNNNKIKKNRPMNKNKTNTKTVYSSKDSVLGNLLQQSYLSCYNQQVQQQPQ